MLLLLGLLLLLLGVLLLGVVSLVLMLLILLLLLMVLVLRFMSSREFAFIAKREVGKTILKSEIPSKRIIRKSYKNVFEVFKFNIFCEC